MKKIIIVLALLTTQVGFAQSRMEKFIQMALDRGADTNGICRIDNVKDKFIYESDVVAFLQNNGYLVLNSSSKKCFKFGNKETIVDKVTFLNGKEGYKKYRHCNNTGAFYYTIKKEYLFSSEITLSEKCKISDVGWSGTTVNGLLDGNGIGVIGFEDGWCAIKCEFLCGIPLSKPEIVYAFPSKNNYASRLPVHFNDKWDRKKMLVKSNDATTDPTLRWAISENLKDYLEEEVQKVVEPEFNKALTLNSLKNMEYAERNDALKKLELWRTITRHDTRLYETIETLNKFLDKYGDSNVNSEWIAKVKEILYVYNLAQNYYAVVLPKQCHCGSITNIAVWNTGVPRFDRTLIRKCIDNLNSVKEKINKKDSPFYDFYNAIYPDIQATEGWINNELEDYLIEDWNRVKEEWERGVDEANSAFMSKMCDKCKINGEKTTVPEGYVPKDDNWLFGHPAHSEKDGTIVFQNGNTSQWSYIYESGGRTIKVTGDYSGKYKNEKEMWDDLLAKCKERYCR
jgi:hypothetical protein